eukprot:CAMPEP_0113313080 /NCGR_PEP_ID=MMETSP0010_2-20120614/9644_1 /TAXON_ID=216773 ORGANISM="Corethron hystrix, Strain 308" /NCGR_SAMPLE_ID=MMETSP0010_2 /ASSEMBLY_ACC=CAM_ASM_000155 /LENGTH=239 /DNA_ID=CAMNT_0000169015 /DNA_START=138 /DNA_END=857 /DNA_ORIENTATION=+ /assembly_acc=CAM_ASM_000155
MRNTFESLEEKEKEGADLREGKLSVKKSVRKPRQWEKEDDELIKKLIEQHGTSGWELISSHFPGRSLCQCRDRWETILDPTLKRGDWTLEEDEIIINKNTSLGNRWVKISKFLYGRTPNSVKNRCSVLKRKSQFLLSDTKHAHKKIKPSFKKNGALFRISNVCSEMETITHACTKKRSAQSFPPSVLELTDSIVPTRSNLKAIADDLVPFPVTSSEDEINKNEELLFEVYNFLRAFDLP